jgi:subtilase family serine protease
MRKIASIAVAAALAVSGAIASAATASANGTARPDIRTAPSRNVCARATAGHMQCFSKILVDGRGHPLRVPSVSGYGPADLQSAYSLPSATNGAGQTIAIVDAYDDPKAESDLAVYRSNFGLSACTTANGCFTKVNQNGQPSPLPAGNTGWAEEISLDLDMASAICPNCHILLVEANNASGTNLYIAENTAVALGATEVSNSWGGGEYGGENTDDTNYFKHPGVAITASSGDNGYGVSYPASSQYVTAVGGTTLTKPGGVWHETAWSGAGSGCSFYVPKPSWQHDAGCARRTVADVSAVANPNTGVAVYDTYNTGGTWFVFGGTSVSSPIIAGVYALAGGNVNYGSTPYGNPAALHDVTSGSNGSCGRKAKKKYLCTAVAGYDGPTGLGTPNGIGAF